MANVIYRVSIYYSSLICERLFWAHYICVYFLLVLVKYLLPVFSLIAIYPFPGGYPSVTSEVQKFDLGQKYP